jgi:deoxyribodipyrimidine photo-lyase
MENVQRLFWFRRDLRLRDNRGLFEALSRGGTLAVFIFDVQILRRLQDKSDRRVQYIHRRLAELGREIEAQGGRLQVFYGDPLPIWADLANAYAPVEVLTNEDYEPYARSRDAAIAELLKERGIAFHAFKDQVICSPEEIRSGTGSSYSVYTPYSRVWLERAARESEHRSYPSEELGAGWAKNQKATDMPALKDMGFEESAFSYPGFEVPNQILKAYAETRNTPSLDATSKLGLHLRFGRISVRELYRQAVQQSETFVKELAWREFFMHVMWHHPRVVDCAYKPAYEAIPWLNREEDIARWCAGETGYPIVDAGMRELLATGFMHNRVRMVVAGFLVKHLLVDWRIGEAWFARHLLDFELASNNGNWQWAAGTGCDAAPYFRVFNPSTQAEKFDAKGEYIRRWVPEIDGFGYPQPMVDHAMARNRAIETYKKALGK